VIVVDAIFTATYAASMLAVAVFTFFPGLL
jgi:hypothetical protein